MFESVAIILIDMQIVQTLASGSLFWRVPESFRRDFGSV